MKLVIVFAVGMSFEVLVGFFALALAAAAKHEPPSILRKKHITVIYNMQLLR